MVDGNLELSDSSKFQSAVITRLSSLETKVLDAVKVLSA
jgi:hypothetical protein